MLKDLKIPKKVVLMGLFAAFVMATSIFISHHHLGKVIDATISNRLHFFIRDKISKSPSVSPKLKILVFDDFVAAKLDRLDLTKAEYLSVLKKIAEKKPKAVLFDRVFSFPLQGKMSDEEFVDFLAKLPFPVYAAGFVAPGIPGWTPLQLGEKLPTQKTFAYGPSPRYRKAFAKVGHAVVEENGYVSLVSELENGALFPHLGLLAADRFQFDTAKKTVQIVSDNAKSTTLDITKPVLTNFIYTREFYPQIRRLSSFLDGAKGENFLNPGDTVLVLPNLFTTSTDFKDTPIGKIPGGFLIASLTSSVLTGQWLREISNSTVFIVFATLLGLFVGIRFYALSFWVASISILVLAPAVSVYLFSFHSLNVFWVLPVACFALTASFVQAVKSLERNQKAQILESTLGGLLPEDQFNEIRKKPEAFHFEPIEKVMSLLFIDIEGYSRVSELYSATECFEHLEKLMEHLTEIVHRHSGVVNKTVGDGMVCYFGHHFGQKQDSNEHVEQIMRCAIEIQERSTKQILNQDANLPLFPLRIGINTARVFLGNVGGKKRIDYTVIGQGVNFAQRLESACESHRIMIGSSTREFLPGSLTKHPYFHKRMIQVKHEPRPVAAFEYNPLIHRPEQETELRRRYNEFRGFKRLEERYPFAQERIRVHTDLGRGWLVNYSRSGLALELDVYLAHSINVEIQFDEISVSDRDLLRDNEIMPLLVKTCWGRPSGDGLFLHGATIDRLNSMQKDILQGFFDRKATKKSA